MTSYTGLLSREFNLVKEFKDALIEKVKNKNPNVDFSAAFDEIDATYAELELKEAEARQGQLPELIQNAQKVYKGWAEAKKLDLVFSEASDTLSAEEIKSCTPKAIVEQTSQGLSRYQMEKNGLLEYKQFLVPQILLDSGIV